MKPRQRLAAAVALAAAAVLHVAVALKTPVGAIIDDAVYLLLAKSLWLGSYALPDGTGLRATSFWPGAPILLALPVRLFEPHWALMRVPALLVSWAALGLTWKLSRKYLSPGWSAACVLLVALNPIFTANAGSSASDMPFLALTLACFCALQDGNARRKPGILELLAALASLTRPEGLLLALALALAVAWREGWRRGLIFLAAAAAPVSLWLFGNREQSGTASDYLRQLAEQMPVLWSPRGQLEHAGRLFDLFAGIPANSFHWPFTGATGLLILMAAAVGAKSLLRRRGDPRVLAIAAFGIAAIYLHLVWWQLFDRYALTLLPLIAILALCGLDSLAAGQARRVLPAAAAVMIGAQALGGAILLSRLPSTHDELWPETMSWIRRQTSPTARLQSLYAPPIMLWTGRPALTPFADVSLRDHWLAKCLNNGIEYLVLEQDTSHWSAMPRPWYEETQRLSQWAASGPYVKEDFRSGSDGTIVYRIKHPAPARYLRAWEKIREAAGAPAKTARAKLREALRLDPGLSSAKAALAELDR
ncbi:MAG: glycosyltransferase family 39 protein [Elusimicrobia bacterium]|nr:glycosyltransferase family 39 protein [Elusimicrobiota bacterium]